jgi:hypothetical protein
VCLTLYCHYNLSLHNYIIAILQNIYHAFWSIIFWKAVVVRLGLNHINRLNTATCLFLSQTTTYIYNFIRRGRYNVQWFEESCDCSFCNKIVYLMYFWYEHIHQSVDFNMKLGKLCVIISLKGKIALHIIRHCKPGDKSLMRKGPGSVYDKWKISVIMCNTDIP